MLPWRAGSYGDSSWECACMLVAVLVCCILKLFCFFGFVTLVMDIEQICHQVIDGKKQCYWRKKQKTKTKNFKNTIINSVFGFFLFFLFVFFFCFFFSTCAPHLEAITPDPCKTFFLYAMYLVLTKFFISSLQV